VTGLLVEGWWGLWSFWGFIVGSSSVSGLGGEAKLEEILEVLDDEEGRDSC
jgi:hypothetical protein